MADGGPVGVGIECTKGDKFVDDGSDIPIDSGQIEVDHARLHRWREPTAHPEVIEDDAAIIVDSEISRMGIAVVHTVIESHREVGIRHSSSDVLRIVALRFEFLEVSNLRSLGVLHGEDTFGADVTKHAWDRNGLILVGSEIFPNLLHHLGLSLEVQFLQNDALKVVRHVLE